MLRYEYPLVERFMYLFMCVLQMIFILTYHFGSRGYSWHKIASQKTFPSHPHLILQHSSILAYGRGNHLLFNGNYSVVSLSLRFLVPKWYFSFISGRFASLVSMHSALHPFAFVCIRCCIRTYSLALA